MWKRVGELETQVPHGTSATALPAGRLGEGAGAQQASLEAADVVLGIASGLEPFPVVKYKK